ncbi:MAG: histidine kinase, partial [Nannocystis sp.]
MAKPQDDRPSELRARLAGFDDPAALLESLFTASPVAYQIFDVDGHCRLVNDAYLGLFGSAPPPDYSILTDKTAAANGNLALIHRAFAGERITLPPFRYDPRELHAAFATPGRVLTLVSSFFPLRAADGRVIFVGLAYKDVTAENEARELAEA